MSKFFYLIRDYLLNNLLNISLKFTRVSIIVLINTSIFSLSFLSFYSVLKVLIDFYNFINDFISFLNNTNELFIKILHSISFFKAFNDAFFVFYPVFSVIFVSIITNHLVKLLISVRKGLDSYNLARIE